MMQHAAAHRSRFSLQTRTDNIIQLQLLPELHLQLKDDKNNKTEYENFNKP